MSLVERFEEQARDVFDPEDPRDFFELAADLARAHAAAFGVPGVRPKSVHLLACPDCGGRVLTTPPPGEDATCTVCRWRGTVAEACA